MDAAGVGDKGRTWLKDALDVSQQAEDYFAKTAADGIPFRRTMVMGRNGKIPPPPSRGIQPKPKRR
ncbi:hypothetical protein GIS00_12075 [Nakamurella sp. YIM 132087]|uniref:Uncharacterized protein n=2 Tax=Nakamurella alba TaxID=2665158 RepID=A0A7K1FKU9_9ACTN|nr:hypothetical protein [Nakamurella alba]